MTVPRTEFPKSYKPRDTEERWRGHWIETRAYAWDPNRGRDETFVVDTPPPTVSGELHVGHMFSYSHQDFIVRFQRMRGLNIFFPIGWDDNGLPTERRVQNLYNVSCEPHLRYDPNLKLKRGRKGDPTPISRRNFIEVCHEVTKEDEEAFRRLWTRLGMSYDWSLEYATIDEHCRRISQLSFLELLNKGELYHAERPVMWDVDFQTAIAQAEVVDKECRGAYHHLNFAIQDSDEKIVIATTRPELLPACVALVAHPKDDRYRHLIGETAVTPLFHVPVVIIADEKADPEKGTGIVMVCTFGDQTDVEWWREHELPIRQIIGRDGRLRETRFREADDSTILIIPDQKSFLGGRTLSVTSVTPIPSLNPELANTVYSKIQGKYVKQAQKIIAEIAEATEGVTAKPREEIFHTVRFFEKGDRPLELLPTPQWYGRVLDKKDALVEQGRKIQWHPEFMGNRYSDWVEGLNQDWCMSRQRYFGVPIPLWYKVGQGGPPLFNERIVPSADALPIDPLDDVPPGYTEDQRNKPGGFAGDPDVLDTWATSSLTPQIASHWVFDENRHKSVFPMDVRPQSHEIIRTWAFYTIVKAFMHEDVIPWKHVVISGWILDPDRKKMSKSRGNAVTPEPLIDQFGADSVRYWAARARLGVDTAYDEQVFKVGKRLCTKLFNASKFAIGRFSELDSSVLTPDKILLETDRAAVAELRPLIDRATTALEKFDYAQALALTEDFFWRTFCDNYLELAKPRTYEKDITEGRLSAGAALRIVHRALLRMFAPYLPYLTEEVWHWAYATDPGMAESIHTSPWPTVEEFAEVPEPQHGDTFNIAVAVIEAVRKAKTEVNLSMKAPVKGAVITARAATLDALETTLEDIVRMLHIEETDLVEGDPGASPVTVKTEL